MAPDTTDDAPGAPRPPSATLTVKQVAPVIGMSEQGVYKAVARGELPAVRVGGKIQILRYPLCEMYGLPPDYDFGD